MSLHNYLLLISYLYLHIIYIYVCYSVDEEDDEVREFVEGNSEVGFNLDDLCKILSRVALDPRGVAR